MCHRVPMQLEWRQNKSQFVARGKEHPLLGFQAKIKEQLCVMEGEGNHLRSNPHASFSICLLLSTSMLSRKQKTFGVAFFLRKQHVVYSDQLLGAPRTRKLFEILFFSFKNFFCDFASEIKNKRLKMNKKTVFIPFLSTLQSWSTN